MYIFGAHAYLFNFKFNFICKLWICYECISPAFMPPSPSNCLIEEYADKIRPSTDKQNYTEKTREIGLDPYNLVWTQLGSSLSACPKLTLLDIGHFLVYRKSVLSHSDIQNYISLQSYQRTLDGWI